MSEALVRAVEAALAPRQAELAGMGGAPDIRDVVVRTVESVIRRTIDIPNVLLLPAGVVTSGFEDFELDVSEVRLEPVPNDILIQHLAQAHRERLVGGSGVAPEATPEDYLVHALSELDDVAYDDHADRLYKLAGQMVSHLRTYLADELAVVNVLQYHQRALAAVIHAQLMAHRWEKHGGYEARITKGFQVLRPMHSSTESGEQPRHFRDPVNDPLLIRGMRFTGFLRCLYPEQRFQSNPERLFAVLLEDDRDVLKWFKAAEGGLQIHVAGDQVYRPDFVVETAEAKYLCEPKAVRELESPEVRAKTTAAVTWCRYATEHESKHGGKPWSYVLIPHDQITADRTFAGLVAAFGRQ